jgi:hypothetical protein
VKNTKGYPRNRAIAGADKPHRWRKKNAKYRLNEQEADQARLELLTSVVRLPYWSALAIGFALLTYITLPILICSVPAGAAMLFFTRNALNSFLRIIYYFHALTV